MSIRLSHITKSYQDKKVLEDFSLIISEGKCTALMGPSGCGKTTLLRIVMGLEKADSGELFNIPERISAVFQEDRLCQDVSAVKNVAMVLGKGFAYKDIIDSLRATGLEEKEFCNKPVSKLSGGMKRRVAIVRAVMACSDLMVLDEPFKGLDEITKFKVINYVKEYAGGKTILFVTHDEREAKLMGDFIVKMS